MSEERCLSSKRELFLTDALAGATANHMWFRIHFLRPSYHPSLSYELTYVWVLHYHESSTYSTHSPPEKIAKNCLQQKSFEQHQRLHKYPSFSTMAF